MPVAPHIVRSPAVLGINEGVRSELVEFGQANLRAENVRAFHQGEASTRYGFASWSINRIGGTTRSAGYKQFANGKQVCVIDGTTCDVYVPALSQWASAGRVPEVGYSTIDLPANYSAVATDMAMANGYIATVYYGMTTNAVYSTAMAVVDASGTEVSRAQVATTSEVASTCDPPTIVAISNRYFIVVWCTVAGTIRADYFDTQAPSSGWTQCGGANLAADAATPYTTFSVEQLTAKAAIVYGNNSGGTARLTVKTFDTTGILQTSTAITTTSAVVAGLSIAGNQGDTLWVGWQNGGSTNVKIIGFSTVTLATVLATAATVHDSVDAGSPAILSIIPTSLASGMAIIGDQGYRATYGLATSHRAFTTTAGATVASGSAVVVPNSLIVSRGFYFNGRTYIQVVSGDDVISAFAVGKQQQVALVDTTLVTASNRYLRPVVVHSFNVSTIGSIDPLFYAYARAKCNAVGNSVYAVHNRKRSSTTVSQEIAVYSFDDFSRWQTCNYRGATSLSGGVVSSFDGERVIETGFVFRPPQVVNITTGTAGPITMAAGGRRYAVVYERVDALGNKTVSGISNPSALSGNCTNKYIDMSIAPCSVTMAARDSMSTVRVALYGTVDGGAPPYYRIATLQNDTALPVFTYRDSVADVVLVQAEKLYAQPSVIGTAQDRRAPPGCSLLVEYNTMLVAAQGRRYFWSGQPVDGEAPWFNPIFQGELSGEGDINAMWVLDGTLILAKRRELYAVTGDVQVDNGQSGGLGPPRRLSADVGAIGPVSCSTALGTFFQSERGIEILRRDGSVDWVGEGIRNTTAAYPICSAMTIDPTSSVLLVELAAATVTGVVNGNGVTAVFDLTLKAWISTDKRRESFGQANAPAQSACMLWTGSAYRYGWLSTFGVTHYEDRTTYLDADGSFVVPLIETGWVNAFQQEQSLHTASIMFQRYTAAGLKIEKAYDYGDYQTIDNSVWLESATVGQRQLELRAKERGESVKFRITSTAPASLGTGHGIGFIGLVLDLAAKQGPVKGTTRLDPALRR